MKLSSVFKALYEGKKVRGKSWKSHQYLQLRDNKLIDQDGKERFCIFSSQTDYWDVIEPSPELWIGKVCFMWDDCEPLKTLGILQDYLPEGLPEDKTKKFVMNKYWVFKQCRPATNEEIKNYIF